MNITRYRSYLNSIAIIWSMSFNIIRNNNSQTTDLFRLLSFLNSEDILINFLQSGVEALQKDLQKVMSNRIDMSKTWIALERFSLLKWNGFTKTLLIHHLVQTEVKDEMSDTEFMIFRTEVINLCDQTFSWIWTNEIRPFCRAYFDHIVK